MKEMAVELVTQTDEIRAGDHLVAFYRELEEVADYITAYIKSALAQNARCIYIAGEEDPAPILREVKAWQD